MAINRIQYIKNHLYDYETNQELINEIFKVLNVTENVPQVGKYYTFKYDPISKQKEYDQYPLIALMDAKEWGFRGYNFHWKSDKNYSWESVKSNFYLVYKEELNDLIELRYGKYHLNSWYNKR